MLNLQIDLALNYQQVIHKSRQYTNLMCPNFLLYFLPTGDQIPPSGDKLLPFSLLFLSYQSSKPALYVWPPQLPAAEQRHRPWWLSLLSSWWFVLKTVCVCVSWDKAGHCVLFCRNAWLHPLGCGCSLLYWQQWAGIGAARARLRNGKVQSIYRIQKLLAKLGNTWVRCTFLGGEVFGWMWTSELSNALS